MIWRIAYRLFVVAWVLVFVTVQVSRKQPALDIELPLYDEVMPGQRLPPDAVCEWQYYMQDSIPCRVIRNTMHIGLDYRPREQRIVTTYYHLTVQHKIGDWLLSKGTPIWFKAVGHARYLTWADGMTAFVYARVFRPDIPVFLVIFGEAFTAEDTEPWRGFVNN